MSQTKDTDRKDKPLKYYSAVTRAFREEMTRDEDVVLIGEDVGESGGIFAQTKGLFSEFGPDRVRDTPIAEAGFTSLAVGAAMTGLRPIVEIGFEDFLTACMDPIVNQAAKLRYMLGGQVKVPVTLYTFGSGGLNAGPQHSQSLAAWFSHVPGLKVVMPSSAKDALGLLKNEEDAKILAGGQSLMPMLNMRFVQPETVIDVNGLNELASISFTDKVEIGALTRQKTLVVDPIIKQHLPIMQEALTWVGHFQTQSRGTIGGSLCHLDPAAELPMVALLYDAELEVASASEIRLIPMQEWALAYMMPSIGHDELLTKIMIKPWRGAYGYGFQEFARRHGDFAIAAAGCLLKIENEMITDIALSIGGVEDVPRRFTECEDILRGINYDIDKIKAVILKPLDQINFLDDSLVTGAYRRKLLNGLLVRAIEQAAGRAKSS